MPKRIISLVAGILGLWCLSAYGQSSYRYWFDEDFAQSRTGEIVNGEAALLLDASHLSDALHQLHIMAEDGQGQSSVISKYFLKMLLTSDENGSYHTTYRYWFDEDFAQSRTGEIVNGEAALLLDASHLSDALHQLHIMAEDGQGQSPVISKYFLKMTLTGSDEGGTSYYHYWFDEDITNEVSGQMTSHEMLVEVDAGELPYGLHQIHVYASDGAGMSSVWSNYFLRTLIPASESGSTQYRWWFDEDMEHTHTGAIVNGEATFVVDASWLPDGMHTINLMAEDGDYLSATIAKYFVKLPAYNNMTNVTCIFLVDEEELERRYIERPGNEMLFELDMSGIALGEHTLDIILVPEMGSVSTYSTVFNRMYLVRFYNSDKTLLYTDTIASPRVPVYKGEEPQRAATAQWTFYFKGWRNTDNAQDEPLTELPVAETSTSYVAVYDSVLNEYTITFQDEDGTVLESNSWYYGETPVYYGNEPSKEDNAEYTYTFAGWDKNIVPVTGDATYTAVYSSERNQYTITFQDEDGTELQSGIWYYGETPAYNGADLNQYSDDDYTYYFAGWDNDIVPVTGDATYTAVYSSERNQYTITFQDEDGTVLESNSWYYGETPVYNGTNPTKEADDEYTYTFAGWEDGKNVYPLGTNLPEVTEDATYTAVYDDVQNEYTVTFQDEDGTVLESNYWYYGETPVYYGSEPSKEDNAEYSYYFAGWDKDIVPVTGDETYSAVYSSERNQYTITFQDEDGTVLESNYWYYGETPVYYGAEPSQYSDDDYTYYFAGWDKDIVPVTGDATYTAVYSSEQNQYTVSFANYDGAILQTDVLPYGATPVYTGETPVREGTEQVIYTFKNWQTADGTQYANDALPVVRGDMVLTANYDSEVRTYLIRFLSDDGEVLQQGDVAYGDMPVYAGPTPAKADDTQYRYDFAGWSPQIAAVVGAADYVAQYRRVVRQYEVVFCNYDDTPLATYQVDYGTIPVYKGATPVRDASESCIYRFSGWSPELTAVTGEGHRYVAQYDQIVLPDAAIRAFSSDMEEGLPEQTVRLTARITNSGYGILPQGTQVAVMQDNKLLTTTVTANDIARKKSDIVEIAVTLPASIGEHTYIVVVNADKAVEELSYTNNASAALTIRTIAPFTATLTADKQVYHGGESMWLTGIISGNKTAYQQVEIYAINYGYRTSLFVETDEEGHFSTQYQPLNGQYGHFSLGACYPGAKSYEEMTGVEVVGLSASYPQVRMVTEEVTSGYVELKNLSQTAMTDIRIEAVAPTGVSLHFEHRETINGNETIQIPFTIAADNATEGNNWQTIPFTVTTAEGVSTSSSIYYYCQAARALLTTDIDAINTTISLTEPAYYSFYLHNDGKGETGNIRLMLPEFIRSMSPAVIPSIKSDGSTPVYLQIVPQSNMQLNRPVTGQIGIQCENANGLTIPFSIEPVSSVTGTLKVDVCDELTYYTEEHPHVAGANVLVMHPTTGEQITLGITGADGLFETTLNAGYYVLAVAAENHQLDTSLVYIEPGRETFKLVNLGTNPVKVLWSVEETEVADEYEIVSTIEYETRVPVPVVILDIPNRIAADELEEGESLLFEATLTNKGWITALDVELLLPEHNPAFTFEALAYTEPFDLGAKQSVTIPVRVTRKVRPQNAPRPRAGRCPPNEPQCKDDDPCVDYPGTLWFWDCSPYDRKYHRYSAVLQLGVCRDGQIDPPSDPGDGRDRPSRRPHYPPGGGGGGGYWLPSLPTWLVSLSEWFYQGGADEDCEPCVNTFLYKMVKCGVKRIPIVRQVLEYVAIIECANDAIENINHPIEFLQTNNCWQSYVPILKEIVEWRETWEECLQPLFEECTNENVGILNAPDKKRGIPSFLSEGKDYSAYPSYIQAYLLNSDFAYAVVQAQFDIVYEIMGDSVFADMPTESLSSLCNYITQWDGESEDIWDYQTVYIPDEKFARFVERIRNTKLGIDSDNRININTILEKQQVIENATAYAKSLGFNSMSEFYQAVEDDLDEHLEGNTSTVCAKVTLQISQDMVMTRQAFEGTLTILNGHETNPMTDIVLNLEIKNRETGAVATSHEFQINLDQLVTFEGNMNLEDGWSLAATETGTAKIIFIPTKYAAETDSVKYSFGGTISYTDPFSGYTITKRLFPQVMTVAPAPNLRMTYFMQRDILGDDPLTEDVEEPMEEAEFALLINNTGNGTAKNLSMVTHQPKIIENEKGLYIDFFLTRSEQNGQQVNLSLDSTIVNQYGNLQPHTTTYVQWYMTSTLLGHFTNYKVEVNHLTGYGNADLSLIEGASIHELIRSVHVPSTQTKTIGWVVNDVVDSDDLPDSLYHTDGSISRVTIATAMEASASTETNAYVLTVSGEAESWVYGNMLDPTNGRQKLVKVVREADNAEISLRNIWQTNCTLRDGKEPLKENRLHIADSLMSSSQSYLLYFGEAPEEEISKEIILLENETTDYYTRFKSVYNGLTINTATLNRQFTEGKWSTLCLPFNVNAAMMTALNLRNRVYEFRYAEIDATENGEMSLYFSIAKSMKAGQGYIVNANAAMAAKTSFTFYGITIDLTADKVSDLTVPDAYDGLDGHSSGKGNISLIGTLRNGMLQGSTEGNTYLGLKDNKVYYPNVTSGTAIYAYRGVFRSSVPLTVSRIRIIADGEPMAELEVVRDEAQTATEAKKFIERGILYIERNGRVYNAQGQIVR